MTIAIWDLAIYALAIFILFLTPGPVWLAIVARGLAGGFSSAWPLALGVMVGDAIWPVLAILGVSWIVSVYGGFLDVLGIVASLMFLAMGGLLIWHADKSISSDSRMTRPGMWAGFVAGLVVILSNPKAILFYMGVLPGFFEVGSLTVVDISAIVLVSMVVPFLGNVMLAAFVGKIRGLLSSPEQLKRLNVTSGGLLICVGLALPFF